MKKQKFPVVNIGTSSILTVFVVLCMVTFAALSYMTADKDARFGATQEKRYDAWLAASNEANARIAEIDAELLESWKQGDSYPEGEALRFSVPIDEDSELRVALVVCDPEEQNGQLYRITEFREVITHEWSGDDTLELFDIEGEGF